MDQNNPFREIGKELPYTVPDGFFEKITDKTISEARIRRRKTIRRNLIISFSVAATLLIAVIAGVTHYLSDSKVQPASFAMEQTPDEQNELPDITGGTIATERKMPEGKNKSHPGKMEETEPEDFEMLLAGLTDEEIRQLSEWLLFDIMVDDLGFE